MKVKLASGKEIEPKGWSDPQFEKELGLNHWTETDVMKNNKKDEVYIDIFFKLLERLGVNSLIVFKIFDGDVTEVYDLSFEEIKTNAYLECEKKGMFYSDHMCKSNSFTDGRSFYATVMPGAILFAGNDESTEILKELFKEYKIKFIQDW